MGMNKPLVSSFLLVLIPVTSFAAPSAAQEQCSPPLLRADAAVYGSGAEKIQSSLPTLQTDFETAFREVCEHSGGSLNLSAQGPVAEVSLLNAPEANVMSIYVSDTAGELVIEYPFEVDGALLPLPDAQEFRRAIICSLDKAEEYALEETACLVD